MPSFGQKRRRLPEIPNDDHASQAKPGQQQAPKEVCSSPDPSRPSDSLSRSFLLNLKLVEIGCNGSSSERWEGKRCFDQESVPSRMLLNNGQKGDADVADVRVLLGMAGLPAALDIEKFAMVSCVRL
jgi:hypothetical protein